MEYADTIRELQEIFYLIKTSHRMKKHGGNIFCRLTMKHDIQMACFLCYTEGVQDSKEKGIGSARGVSL